MQTLTVETVHVLTEMVLEFVMNALFVRVVSIEMLVFDALTVDPLSSLQ